MYGRFQEYLQGELDRIKAEGLYKLERVLTTSQGVEIRTDGGPKVLNFCANNYLGLCNEPRVMTAANYTFFRLGYGMASVRFICGTSEVHKELERRMSEFLGTDDTLLYSSAFDANGGVFEPLLGEDSAIISDELKDRLMANTARFRKGVEDAGFRIIPGIHPIVPILLGHLPNDAKLSQNFANALLEEGIYVIGFYFPVVPRGNSRIRVQVSAAHTPEQIDFAVEKFTKVGRALGAI